MEYRKRYGVWAGNERGHKPDRTRCAHELFDNMIGRQCQNRVWKGNCCKTHHPDTQKKRMIESEKRLNTRLYEEFMRYGVRDLVEALVDIERGHNDPRTRATESLEKLRAKKWWREQ